MVDLIATSTFGLESVVAQELKTLGYEDLKVSRGKVKLNAKLNAICRMNMWLRCADRVLLQMGEFRANTFDQLFERTKALPWAEWIPEDAEFPVVGKSVSSQLSSVPACQSIVKKAVVTALGEHYGRTRFDETGPRTRIQISLHKDMATLTLDTSGDGLHRRGYRDQAAPAPLRETLAAGLVYLSHWRPEYVFADPCCGSGTLLIEAAMIGRNIAPGTLRSFDSFRWPAIPRELWSEALDEADDLAKPEEKLRIIGSDISSEAIALSKHHVERAGFEEGIKLQRGALKDFHSKERYGYLVCNPPYGERLGDTEASTELYEQMGVVFPKLRDWSWFVLTPSTQFEELVGKEASFKRKLYNGRLEVTYYQFYGPKPPNMR